MDEEIDSIIYEMDSFIEVLPPLPEEPHRVWCYTLAIDSIYPPIYDIGTNDEVTGIRLHHLYECMSDHPDLGVESYHRLYYTKGFPIDVYEIQAAIRNFDPTTQTVRVGDQALTFKGEDVTIKEKEIDIMSRDLQEVLNSGELTGMAITENIQFIGASDPAYEGTVMRVGDEGFISLYRIPNQDAEWIDTDTEDREVTTTPVEHLTVTPDLEVTPDDGSYTVTGSLGNTSNQTRAVSVAVYVDDVLYGDPYLLTVGDNETGRLFSFSGFLGTTINASQVISVRFSADAAGVTLEGSETATSFKLVKQGANPV